VATLIVTLSTLGLMVFIVLALIALFKKTGKAKKMFKGMGICFAILIVCSFFVDPAELESASSDKADSEKAIEATATKESKTDAKATEKEKKSSEEAEAKEEAEKKAAAKAKAKEEAEKKAAADKQNKLEKETYVNNIKATISEINKEYDSIWEKDWRPAWDAINNNTSDINDLALNMENVSNGYSSLSTKLIEFKPDGLSEKHNQMFEDYRIAMGKAIAYRGNAGRAITQAITGVADIQSRMEEAKKSVELADKYMLEATVNIVTLEKELGVLQ
jgi:chromosome segregation ATPase